MKALIKALVSLCFTSALLSAQSGINYQGRLTNSSGAPVTGTKTFSIAIYPSATGGQAIYSESIGSVTLDANGVYNFQFGVNGTSVSAVSLPLGSTVVGQAVYSKVLPEAAIAGSVNVSDGVNTWSQSTGSSSPATFLGSYDSNSRTVTAIYLGQIPSVSRSITIDYSRNTSGLFSALNFNQSQWLQLTIDSNIQSPRERLLAVPYAVKSKVSDASMAAVGDLSVQLNEIQNNITSLAQGGLAELQVNSGLLSHIFDSSSIDIDSSVSSQFPTRFRAGRAVGFYDVVEIYDGVNVAKSGTVFPVGGYTHGLKTNYQTEVYKVEYVYADGTKGAVLASSGTYPPEGGRYFPNPKPSKKVVNAILTGSPSLIFDSIQVVISGILRYYDAEISVSLPSAFPKRKRLGVYLNGSLVPSSSFSCFAKNAQGESIPLRLSEMNDVGDFSASQVVLRYQRPLTSDTDMDISIIRGLVIRSYD
jgi:hypothetical protein